MTPDLWQRVREVYARAAELPAKDRTEWVLRHSGRDRLLAREVLALLEVDVEAAEVLLQSPIGEAEASLVGRRLGKWTLQHLLGCGSMGAVYYAVAEDGELAAVKVLTRIASTRPRAVTMFRREAAAVTSLCHPGIVPLVDFDQCDGHWFYAMEYIDGVSLGNAMRGKGPVTDKLREPRHATLLIADVLDALEHAHERKIVHRDIKPDNLLIAPDGRPRIVDFGVAKDLALENVTASGALTGTPHYMSPEQAASVRRPIDHRSDLFSVAVVLYQLLTGQLPFPGQELHEVLNGILHRAPRSIRRAAPSVPAAIARVCHQALCKNRDYRFESAAEFAHALREAVAGRAIPLEREPLVQRAVRACANRRVTVALGAALAASLVLTTVLATAASAATGQLTISADRPVTLQLKRFEADPEAGATEDSLGAAGANGQTLDLEPGRVRLIATSSDGERHELTRTLVEGQDLVVQITRATAVATPMRHIAGGTHRMQIEVEGRLLVVTCVVQSYWIDERTVTNGEFLKFLRSTGRTEELEDRMAQRSAGLKKRSDWDQLPATYVAYELARAYAEWCGKRLPTRAEWDLACSEAVAKKGRNDPTAGQNLGVTVSIVDEVAYLDGVQPAAEGTGIFAHALGNVWEWIDEPELRRLPDGWGSYRHTRVALGNFWGTPRSQVRDKGRANMTAVDSARSASIDIGFRCVRTSSP